jgi:GTPase SAR1 family protein
MGLSSTSSPPVLRLAAAFRQALTCSLQVVDRPVWQERWVSRRLAHVEMRILMVGLDAAGKTTIL